MLSAMAALASAAPAAAQYPEGPFAPWDGTNPFRCVVQDAGTGTTVPDPDADPYCVEFDKTQQNVTDLGILEFLSGEPARVAAAGPKCFYFQTDHWTGSVVQGNPQAEVWHWDGQYFFDKAVGVGGVNVQNFRFFGQPASPSDYGEVPPDMALYMDQSGGGAYIIGGIEADPACAARVDTPEEAAQIYANGPPPRPQGGVAGASGANRAKAKCKRKRKAKRKRPQAAARKPKRRCKKRKRKKRSH